MRTLSAIALRLYDYLVVYLGLIWLGLLCLVYSAATLFIGLLLPKRWGRSIGLITNHAQVPVQTVLIETDTRHLSQGWTLFRKPPLPLHFRVRPKRFDPPQHTQTFMAELEHYFNHDLVHGSAFYPTNELPLILSDKS